MKTLSLILPHPPKIVDGQITVEAYSNTVSGLLKAFDKVSRGYPTTIVQDALTSLYCRCSVTFPREDDEVAAKVLRALADSIENGSARTKYLSTPTQ